MRQETFRVDDGMLVRAANPGNGKPYEHRCPLATFEQIGHAIDALAGAAFTLESLHDGLNLPWTQIAVAFAFMKERGCVAPAGQRRHKAASAGVHLDAMIEWHALRDGAPGSVSHD